MRRQGYGARQVGANVLNTGSAGVQRSAVTSSHGYLSERGVNCV